MLPTKRSSKSSASSSEPNEARDWGPMNTPDERWQVAHDYLQLELGWEEDRILAVLRSRDED